MDEKSNLSNGTEGLGDSPKPPARLPRNRETIRLDHLGGMDEHLSSHVNPHSGLVMGRESRGVYSSVNDGKEKAMKLRCMITAGIATLLILTAAVPPLRAQNASPKPGDEVLASWNYIGGKLITMAEDFPESKYEFKPAPASRSFAAQLLHVAGTNYAYVNALSGKKMGPDANDPSRSVYKTKAQVVAVLKKSFADGAALIKAHSDQLTRIITDPDSGRPSSEFLSWLNDCEHSGEHYGQLVVYYRVNGLVPPESRRRAK